MLEMLMAIPQEKVDRPVITKLETSNSAVGVLTEKKNLYMMGRGDLGNLGSGTTDSYKGVWFLSNTDVEDFWMASASILKKTDGTWWYAGSNQFLGGAVSTALSWTEITSVMSTIPSTDKVTQVAFAASYALFLTDKGRIYNIGINSSGQLFNGTTTAVKTLTDTLVGDTDNPVIKIAVDPTSNATSYVLFKDGTLKGAGGSKYGQLGVTTDVKSLAILESGVIDFWAVEGGYYALNSAGLTNRGKTGFGQLSDGVDGTTTTYRATSFQLTNPSNFKPSYMHAGLYQVHAQVGDDWYFTGNTSTTGNSGSADSSSPWYNTHILNFTKIPTGMEVAKGNVTLATVRSNTVVLYCLVGGVLYGAGTTSTYNLLPGLPTSPYYGLYPVNVDGVL